MEIQSSSWRTSNMTVAVEKVEKVVRPPKKPVVIMSRISGADNSVLGEDLHRDSNEISPSRVVASVPSGGVGNTGLGEYPTISVTRPPGLRLFLPLGN